MLSRRHAKRTSNMVGVITRDRNKLILLIDTFFFNKKARQRLIPSRNILVLAVLRGQREPLYNTLSNLSNVFLYFLTPKQTFFTNPSHFSPQRRANSPRKVHNSIKQHW
jgi:hypothetical protein